MTTDNTSGWKIDEAKADEQTAKLHTYAGALGAGAKTCEEIRAQLAACWGGTASKKVLADLDAHIKVLGETATLLEDYATKQGDIVETYREAERQRNRIQI